MNYITLEPPRIKDQEVTFEWKVDPPTELYHQPRFTLRFPPRVDLTKVSSGVWWRVALICLHSQWPLLRPCEVRLPVTLADGEAETWLRLTDVAVATLEAYRNEGTGTHERAVSIVEDGPLLIDTPFADTGRCATAFSGGKDSLVQTGLLSELTTRPLLVTVTSPMPPLSDHVTPRRRFVLGEITKRRDVELIEVESDYRSNFDHGFAMKCGYWISVNEMSDALLYTAALLAVSAARGVTHCFLASENEVQRNLERDGRIIQHRHYMYSVLTQRALQAVIRPLGLRYSSLTSPLYNYQVQELLWTRYPDLRDLQYSCWRVQGEDWMCNACSQCLRLAFTALALRDRPSLMGIELVKLLNAMRDWEPPSGTDASTQSTSPVTPRQIVSAQMNAQMVRSIAATSLRDPLRDILFSQPLKLLTREGRQALHAYAALRERARHYGPVRAVGYQPGYLRLIDPLLRESVAAIYAEHFTAEDEHAADAELARIDAAINWITEPIGGEN